MNSFNKYTVGDFEGKKDGNLRWNMQKLLEVLSREKRLLDEAVKYVAKYGKNDAFVKCGLYKTDTILEACEALEKEISKRQQQNNEEVKK